MNIASYIGEATAYDKKLEPERKYPLSWLKSVSAFANTIGADRGGYWEAVKGCAK